MITLRKSAIQFITELDPLLVIEMAARVCYKSEDKIVEGSAEPLIRKLLHVYKHESVIEHSNVLLKVSKETWYALQEWVTTQNYLDELDSTAARSFLRFTMFGRPLVSGNFRAWIDVLKRTRCFAEIYDLLRERWPVIFESIPEPRTYYDGRGQILSPHEECTLYESLEHHCLTVRFITDRGVTHELVRHRPPAFSQESTRYCNYGKSQCTFILPPWVSIPPGDYLTATDACDADTPASDAQWLHALIECAGIYTNLLTLGWKPQQARGVLPNSLKTEIIVTANMREWRNIFRLRTVATAHPQMQEIMVPTLYAFKLSWPKLFSDLWTPYHDKQLVLYQEYIHA